MYIEVAMCVSHMSGKDCKTREHINWSLNLKHELSEEPLDATEPGSERPPVKCETSDEGEVFRNDALFFLLD